MPWLYCLWPKLYSDQSSAGVKTAARLKPWKRLSRLCALKFIPHFKEELQSSEKAECSLETIHVHSLIALTKQHSAQNPTHYQYISVADVLPQNQTTSFWTYKTTLVGPHWFLHIPLPGIVQRCCTCSRQSDQGAPGNPPPLFNGRKNTYLQWLTAYLTKSNISELISPKMALYKLHEPIRERAFCKHEKCTIGKALCCPQQPPSYYNFSRLS